MSLLRSIGEGLLLAVLLAEMWVLAVGLVG